MLEPARLSLDYDLDFIRRRYNLVAKVYPFFEFAFLLPRGIRERAVKKLELANGSRVLEVGCGTGRNLPYLVRAVGTEGVVYGVDYSDGMLSKARLLSERHRWPNVKLFQQDAAQVTLPEPIGVLFSLSYAVMSEPMKVLTQVWKYLRAGAWVVIMDAKLPSGRLGRLMRLPVSLISKATVLGDPDKLPWSDLKQFATQVEMEQVNFGTYYLCRVRKS